MIASENILKYCFLTIYEDGGGGGGNSSFYRSCSHPAFRAFAHALLFFVPSCLNTFQSHLTLTLSGRINLSCILLPPIYLSSR